MGKGTRWELGWLERERKIDMWWCVGERRIEFLWKRYRENKIEGMGTESKGKGISAVKGRMRKELGF